LESACLIADHLARAAVQGYATRYVVEACEAALRLLLEGIDFDERRMSNTPPQDTRGPQPGRSILSGNVRSGNELKGHSGCHRMMA
jgi:hypothetical protein